MPARIEQVVLPGPELEARRPEGSREPVVLRVVNAYPHGTAFRYDLEYYGLEPGTFNLADYLVRQDGTPASGLPELRVEVRPLLPPGQVEPHALEPVRPPWLGGYRAWMIVAGVVWVLGLGAILFAGRRRKKGAGAAGRPLTLAERLRPMVEGAVAGRLSPAELADLERTLLAYWRRRLGLERRKPAEALAELRRHPEAGPLLEQLETWLHRPNAAGRVDVAALLKPYQDLPAEALDESRMATDFTATTD
jgi:hypothetical protein